MLKKIMITGQEMGS